MKFNLNEIEDVVFQKIGNEFDIEYIEYVKEANNNILRVVIDKKSDENTSVDDCEKVSRLIEEDVDKYINDEYVLEVCSAGLERQLKNIKLYNKYKGKKIHVKLYRKNEYGKEFECILKDVIDDNNICIVINENEVVISLKDIALAYTVYDFSLAFKSKDNVNINK